MGKLEKVVVLSVLFVIAVILVVSLTTDDPIDKKNVTVLGQPPPKVAEVVPAANGTGAAGAVTPPAADVAAQPPANGGAAPATLLSANVKPNAAPGTTAPTAPGTNAPALSNVPPANTLPTGSILMTMDGLSDSYLPDMKFYTWQAGDTFRGVANTFYGDWTKLALLRRANEGRKNVQPGEKILVPVFDLDAPPSTSVAKGAVAPKNAVTPKNDKAVVDANAKKSSKSTKANEAAPASGGGKTHVVKEGESLWKIAKAELGNGALWEKIYQANKDVMKTPEALKTGMKLKIP
ncbi:MAG: LysM peptidoglycan-binding domain-containing protein [Planctomycetes bacterium]|nr:LysM peptidoglycan-binding domain-containing protein [Planctomycetota bacterium]